MRTPARVVKCLRDGAGEGSPITKALMPVSDALDDSESLMIQVPYAMAVLVAEVLTYPLIFAKDVLDGLSGCGRVVREYHPEVAWELGMKDPIPDPDRLYRVSVEV